MTFDEAQRCGVVNMVEHDGPKPPPYCYTHAIALEDMLGQAEAMMKRSLKFKTEEEVDGNLDEADKHMRVYCVLKELHRLGGCFRDRADGKFQ